eukprot:gene8903-biopygen6740
MPGWPSDRWIEISVRSWVGRALVGTLLGNVRYGGRAYPGEVDLGLALRLEAALVYDLDGVLDAGGKLGAEVALGEGSLQSIVGTLPTGRGGRG